MNQENNTKELNMRNFLKTNKLFWEYLSYFSILVFFSYLFYTLKIMYGGEHILSAWQVFLGYTPFLDFFEHHGPLQYYLFAPLFYFGGFNIFPLWIILINSAIGLLVIKYFFSIFELRFRGRIIISALFIWLWVGLFGGIFFPETYIACLVVLIYVFFLKIGSDRNAPHKYFVLLGFLFGMLFLIKFNAFVLMFTGLVVYGLLNLKREPRLVNLNNIARFIIGILGSISIFLIVFRHNLEEVFYWMFTYNFQVVSSLARSWPPQPSDLFFIVLLINIIILCLLYFDKNNRNKYYKFTFPIWSSLFLLLVSYPRYGDSHLLPAMIGFLVGLILVIKEGLYKINLYKVKIPISRFTKFLSIIFLTLLSLYIFLTLINFLFYFSKITFRVFWSHPDEYYDARITAESANYIKNKKCQHVYIYPSDQFSQFMYPQLIGIKNIKFIYPSWRWTFTEDIQKSIVQDLRNKKVDCVLFSDDISESALRSQLIENYIASNYHQDGKISLRVYYFDNLFFSGIVNDYKAGGRNFYYNLFLLN